MTTNPKKPAICWGMFRVIGLASHVPKGHHLERSAYVKMRVTSFSKTYAGTRMAHGSQYETGQSVHRQADGMFFYESEEAMNKAARDCEKIEPGLVAGVHAALEASAEAQRHYRVVMEQHLGKHAIQPLELEVL